jgi:cyclic pyranopterin phosphate synthase
MADIGATVASVRAVARTRVTMLETTSAQVSANEMKKGDVLGTARFAGIQAARHAPTLFPLPTGGTPLKVTVGFEVGPGAIEVEVAVEAADLATAELPALAAAAVAALTIFDMCKAVDRTMSVDDLALVL